jgi:N6-adenosine-specific RNA methylase IME4
VAPGLYTSKSPKYRTIVADPPWPIGDFPQWSTSGKTGRIPRPYDVMTLSQIAGLDVGALADRHAHLYLWTITRWLEQSYGVARSWGFEPSAVLAWCKPEQPGGLGGAYPANLEFILFCTRRVGGSQVLQLTTALADRADELRISRKAVDLHMGTSDMGPWWLSRLAHRCACPTGEQWERLREFLQLDDPDLDALVESINADKGQPTATGRATGQWFTWPRGRHSEKPEAFFDLVEQVSPGPYLELFARRNRLGWDTWGDEALQHVEVVA